jgi:hypothetical protein
MGDLATIGAAYAALARTVPALNDATRTKPVADIRHFLRMGQGEVTPFCLFVAEGGVIGKPEAIRDVGALQEEVQHWSAYLGAASFGPEGEGAFAPAAGMAAGEDAASLLAALLPAVQGGLVYSSGGILSRAYPEQWGLYDVTETAVIYRVRFFNPFLRQS